MDRSTSRLRPCLILALALCTPMAAQAQDDPAYVDGPAGRALPDPARADGGSFGSSANAVPNTAALIEMRLQALQQQQQLMQGPTPQTGGPPGTVQGMGQPMAMGPAYGGAGPGQRAGMDQGYGVPAMGSQAGAGEGYGYGVPGMASPTGMGAGYGVPPGPGAAPQPGPMQQIGSGLMQDAAGVLDANIQRQIYGPNGPVVAYPPPGVPPMGNGPGW